jgi:hypothetical protein
MQGWPAALRQQANALLSQFLNAPPALIGIAGLEHLSNLNRLYGGRVEVLGSEPMDRAFVWMHGAEPQLWVNPASNAYRDLYDQFARERLNLPGRPSGTDFNIDHLFPRTAGELDGLSHVRMMAIGARSNQSAGRTLEKAMAGRAREAAGGKVIRSATWQTIGKVAGFAGWESLPANRGEGNPAVNRRLVQALFDHLQGLGITPPAGGVELVMTEFMIGGIR